MTTSLLACLQLFLFVTLLPVFITADVTGAPFLNPLSSDRARALGSTTSPYKGYSGYRVSNSTRLLLYHHDQTIAIVEVGSKRRILSCELIEVLNDDQAEDALFNLSKRVGRARRLKLGEMLELMAQCDKVNIVPTDPNLRSRLGAPTDSPSTTTSSSIINGVLPGTKWCGVGDIADTYYDLGTESNIDRCCRKHDLCPVKVRTQNTRYNLTNNSIYTKSHCVCDEDLRKCLKSAGRSVADFMGNIYFNILRIPCIEQGNGGLRFREPDPY